MCGEHMCRSTVRRHAPNKTANEMLDQNKGWHHILGELNCATIGGDAMVRVSAKYWWYMVAVRD